MAPIEQPALRERLIAVLDDALKDNRLAWDLDAEGNYKLRSQADGEPERNFQERLMKQAHKRAKTARLL